MLPNQRVAVHYLLVSPPPAAICAPLTRRDTRMRERTRGQRRPVTVLRTAGQFLTIRMAAPFNWHWTQWIMEWCRPTLPSTRLRWPCTSCQNHFACFTYESAIMPLDNTLYSIFLLLRSCAHSFSLDRRCSPFYSSVLFLGFTFCVIRFVSSISFLVLSGYILCFVWSFRRA